MSESRRGALVVLLCAFVVAALAFGIRQSFGLFMRPISLDLDWGRESLSLVIAIQALLNGLAAPFAGAMSDKWGVGRTVALGGALYCVGLIVMSQSTTPAGMIVGGGVLVGMGVSACGMPVLLAAVGRVAPRERRSMWLGVVTAGATAGQLGVIPVAQGVIAAHGWGTALVVFASCTMLILPLALLLGFADRDAAPAAQRQTLGDALAEAARHRGYVLLTLGFFVCGFQVQFIAAHLPAFIEDQGLGKQLAATALVLIALCNMAGAWIFGTLGDRRRKRHLLAGIYLARAIVIAVFVSLPVTHASVTVFAAIIGFIWLGTVPLTSGLIAQLFGPRYMATLYAIVYLSHQLGNFLGAWIGGRIFDATGSYEPVWWISVALGVAAALLHASIDDRPVRRLAAAH